MRFDDDPRLDDIIKKAKELKGIEGAIKTCLDGPAKGQLMIQQVLGYERLRAILASAGPSWSVQVDLNVAVRPLVCPATTYVPKAGTFTRRLFEFLKGRAGTEYHYRILAAEFRNDASGHTESVVRGRLSFLKRKGAIEHTGRGCYRYVDPWARPTLPAPPAGGA
jgi:hypothetical protein